MKKTILGVTAITIAMLITGCGNNTDEVAKDFVLSLSNGDRESAKELASEKIMQKIDNIQAQCNMVESEKLAKQTREWLDAVRKVQDNKDAQAKLKVIEEEYQKEKKELGKKMEAEIKSRYPDVTQMSAKIEKEVTAIAFKKLYPVALEMIEGKMSVGGVKAENQEQMERVLAWRMMGMSIEQAARKVMEEDPVDFSPKCVDSASEFGFIDDINVLEVKELSADEEVVRLELVNEEGDSNKIDMHVEKIKGDWLVSDY